MANNTEVNEEMVSDIMFKLMMEHHECVMRMYNGLASMYYKLPADVRANVGDVPPPPAEPVFSTSKELMRKMRQEYHKPSAFDGWVNRLQGVATYYSGREDWFSTLNVAERALFNNLSGLPLETTSFSC